MGECDNGPPAGMGRCAEGLVVATRSGFEPPISALTGQYVNRYTTGPRGNAVWFQGCLGVIIRRAGGFVKWYRATIFST